MLWFDVLIIIILYSIYEWTAISLQRNDEEKRRSRRPIAT